MNVADLRFAASCAILAACSQPQPGPSPVRTAPGRASAGPAAASSVSFPGAAPCGGAAPDAGTVGCFRFAKVEDAFRAALATSPLVVAIGEAHAQKGSEGVASSTKRFTEELLPLVAPRASDVVVELWAPDPKCQKEVKKVATAQRPVVEAQAPTNQNEYVTLGTRAKELGMTPWLLRPTCDDFAALADAGADAVPDMLRLVKRLTEEKVGRLYERNRSGGPDGGDARRVVLAYGGALHNDLHPAPDEADYAFGPDLDRLTGGRYVELDLIVPEYVKDTSVWQRLPWYAAWRAAPAPPGTATLFVLADRSYTLVLPPSARP